MQYFSFPDYGDSTRWYDLTRAFQAVGHEVTVITTSGFMHLPVPQDFQREGTRFFVLNAPVNNQTGYLKRVFQFVRFSFFAVRKLLFWPSDLLIASSTPLTIALPALINRWIKGTPFIFEVRDVWPDAPIAIGVLRNPALIWLSRRLEQSAYRWAAHIVALSSDMKQTIVQSGQVTAEKVKVIPNIAHLGRFLPVQKHNSVTEQYEILAKSKKIVLYTGTFGQVNGLGYTVDLFQKMCAIDPHIIFVAFGLGKARDRVIQAAQQNGIWQKNYFVFDPVPKDALPYLLSLCTVTSSWVIDVEALWANSANKYFDALAAGKPIVINYGGWQKQEITTCKTGLVLSPSVNDAGLNARTLSNFIKDDAQLMICGKNAIALAQKAYSLEIASDQYLKIIKYVS